MAKTLINDYITSHYAFRVNAEKKLLGKNALEFKRNDWNHWIPISQFATYEANRILHKSGYKKSWTSRLTFSPETLVQRMAEEICKNAPIEGKNAAINELVAISPVRVANEEPRPTSARELIDLKEGDLCYICLDASGKQHTALPAMVDTIHRENHDVLYNVLVVKADKRNKVVLYHGKHMVFANEVGRTPGEAVRNLAFSQIVY